MKKSNPKFTVLVNTCDSFEDCWYPFFTLFNKYWPKCEYPILLNTEFKDYSFKDIEMKATKVNKDTTDRRLTWSECLIGAVNQADTPLILYFQEDYFLDQPVDVEFIEKMSELMLSNPKITRLGLVTTDTMGKFIPFEQEPKLWQIRKGARYTISMQVSLWRKEALLSYLKPEENGWMFEIFGTWRAWKRNEVFLTLNKDIFKNQTSVTSYLHTGIIKGKWHPGIPKQFEENGIELDFSKRGFYDLEMPVLKRKFETFRKLISSPKLLLNAMFDLI
jgi:hypothetical protein